MKTAIYIEDGVIQLVLTPQDSFEQNILESLSEKQLELTVQTGSFYKCRGGWMHQDDDDNSLIIRVTAKQNPDPAFGKEPASHFSNQLEGIK